MKAFSKFISINFRFGAASFATTESKKEYFERTFEESVRFAKQTLFADVNGSVFTNSYEAWTPTELKGARFVLIEFAVNYRS